MVVARTVLFVGLMAGLIDVSHAADNPCIDFPKGATQTSVGMCIDGVLFKDVLARLAALESRLGSPTNPQGKLVH